nr:biotin--[acetyl-CoA-carboxylase] ligase [Desulfobulbaceae bacterium]
MRRWNLCVSGMCDTILQQAIDSGRLGSIPFYWHESIGSTNQKALEMVRNGLFEQTIIMADSQTSGRGRLGRSWVSPAGSGLYVSIVLWPQVAPEHLSKLTLVAGVAVNRAINLEATIATMIKWPNDIVVDGKKVAGILAESTAVTSRGKTAVVLGIGVNVTTPLNAFPLELSGRVTSLLAVSGKRIHRGVLLKRLVSEIAMQMELFEGGSFSTILEEWKRRDATLGKRLHWLNSTKQAIYGVSLGPDKDGRLQVRDASGKVHEVLSGDVTLAEY